MSAKTMKESATQNAYNTAVADLKRAKEKLYHDGWGSKGAIPELNRDVLDDVILSLLDIFETLKTSAGGKP